MELRICGSEQELAKFLKALGAGEVIAKVVKTTDDKKKTLPVAKRSKKTVSTGYLAKKYNVTPQCIRTYAKAGMPFKKDGNVLAYDEVEACVWIDNYMATHVSKNRGSKYSKTKSEIKKESDYTKWRKNISEICRNSGFDEGKLLSLAYKRMTRIYGVVWEQLYKEFYQTHGRKPVSTLEVAYSLEKGNSVYTNMLEGNLDAVIKEM